MQAVAVSHYNVIASVVQVSTFNRIHEEYLPWEYRRFRPGDVCAGGASWRRNVVIPQSTDSI